MQNKNSNQPMALDEKSKAKFFATTLERFTSYMNMAKPKVSKLAADLKDLVSKEGITVFNRFLDVETYLREKSYSDLEIERVKLMLRVNSIGYLVQKAGNTDENLVKTYIVSALEETGLTRSEVLRLGQAILYAMGAGVNIESEQDIRSLINLQNSHYVVPVQFYAGTLKAIQQRIDLKAANPFMNITEELVDEMYILARAGIPKAMYYYGLYLLKTGGDENNAQAESYIISAAENGVPEAELILADREMTKGAYSKAYDMYTGIPARALDDKAKKNLFTILAQKKSNLTTLIISVVLAVVSLVLLVVAPGSNTYEAKLLWGILLEIPVLAAPGLGFWHFKAKPFDSVFWVPCAQLVSLSIYNIIRFLG